MMPAVARSTYFSLSGLRLMDRHALFVYGLYNRWVLDVKIHTWIIRNVPSDIVFIVRRLLMIYTA